MNKPQFFDVGPADYGADEAAMVAYRDEGNRRARQLENRGPLELDREGRLASEILDAYNAHGFYVFEGLIEEDELADVEADVAEILERAPRERGAEVDRHGRPAINAGLKGRNLNFVRPFSDPVGGTTLNHGRHPAKMNEPSAPDGAPEWVLQLVLGSLQFSDACLRIYGHPKLLAAAASINGDDFVPFSESLWIKHPRLGGSVAWHQDGWTHWDSPDLDEHTHGFNFMTQLYGCDAENGLWVVPGSHRLGKVDIKAWVEEAGSDRLPQALPLLCDPGDVAICNRQTVHGSFANTSDKPRVTVNCGFHPRKSVLGVLGGGVHNERTVYDEERIAARSRLIPLAIDARSQRFPAEERFVYEPTRGSEGDFRFDDSAREELRDYNVLDLGI